MKYKSPLIAVTDMERSKAFYKKYLCLDVEVDFGANVTLTGGIALQTLDSWRGFIGGIDVSFKNNAVELYFEKKDFDTANLSRKSKIEQNTPRYATILCNIKRYF